MALLSLQMIDAIAPTSYQICRSSSEFVASVPLSTQATTWHACVGRRKTPPPSWRCKQTRQSAWNAILRETGPSADRVLIFVRLLAGHLGESVERTIVEVDTESEDAYRQYERMRKESQNKAALLQAKVVETMIGTVLKESSLVVGVEDSVKETQAASSKLVVFDQKARDAFQELASGASTRPFFDAHVGLKNALENQDSKPTLQSLVREAGAVGYEFMSFMEQSQMRGALLSRPSPALMSSFRNSLCVRLKSDVVAAIRKSLSTLNTELRAHHHGVSNLTAWELIEGKDEELRLLFAEFCANILQGIRMTSSSLSAYIGMGQVKMNTVAVALSLRRLVRQVCSYRLSTKEHPNYKNSADREKHFDESPTLDHPALDAWVQTKKKESEAVVVAPDTRPRHQGLVSRLHFNRVSMAQQRAFDRHISRMELGDKNKTADLSIRRALRKFSRILGGGPESDREAALIRIFVIAHIALKEASVPMPGGNLINMWSGVENYGNLGAEQNQSLKSLFSAVSKRMPFPFMPSAFEEALLQCVSILRVFPITAHEAGYATPSASPGIALTLPPLKDARPSFADLKDGYRRVKRAVKDALGEGLTKVQEEFDVKKEFIVKKEMQRVKLTQLTGRLSEFQKAVFEKQMPLDDMRKLVKTCVDESSLLATQLEEEGVTNSQNELNAAHNKVLNQAAATPRDYYTHYMDVLNCFKKVLNELKNAIGDVSSERSEFNAKATSLERWHNLLDVQIDIEVSRHVNMALNILTMGAYINKDDLIMKPGDLSPLNTTWTVERRGKDSGVLTSYNSAVMSSYSQEVWSTTVQVLQQVVKTVTKPGGDEQKEGLMKWILSAITSPGVLNLPAYQNIFKIISTKLAS